MNADRVEVSWDAGKSKWLVRIEVGAEVIRRHSHQPKGAADEALRADAESTTKDEGYQVAAANIAVRR
jgi:hypothetical protein